MSRARAETYLSKLKLQFQHSATENVLMSRQLNSTELMKLTGQPARLIVALYEHSSIEQHFRDAACQTCPGEKLGIDYNAITFINHILRKHILLNYYIKLEQIK